jgi:transposase
MKTGQEVVVCSVIGGVDTHKDLHVAAVVDEHGHVLGSQCFATTRHGYKQMLAWMQSFGQLRRIGVEATGTYGAGLLRYMRSAGVEVLEVTAPDKHDRRKRGKNDDLDAQNAAHAALTGKRTVTPKSRDGMIESLRVLKACRKTAVAARRVALQMIQNTIVCAPDELRETLRKMTRMQLVRTLAAWRPDLTDYRNVVSAYRITLKSLGRRYLELHDEIADLATIRSVCIPRPASRLFVVRAQFPPLPAKRPAIASIEAVIERRTARCTSSRSAGSGPIREPRPTWPNASPRAIPSWR